jgi:hypothetical protein
MGSFTVSLIVFGCIFGGTLLGMAIRTRLPDHHLSEESKDVVKLGTGMIATMAALVLALLLASAKGTFDTMNNEIRLSGAKLVLLDRVMAQYGPETKELRDHLRRGLATAIERFWQKDSLKVVTTSDHQTGGIDFEVIQNKLQKLSPRNDSQRWLQSRALQISADIAETRWHLIEAVGHSSLPVPFLVKLVCWLTIIFASFGLFSPRNETVIIVLFICALSAAAAFFLILELDHPYQGFIKVSSAPLQKALAIMGQ